MKKGLLFGVVLSLLAVSTSAMAQVTVRPSVVGVSSLQVFSVGVNSDHPGATTIVRLSLPAGLQEVLPNVKPGWATEVERDGGIAKAIIWKGGLIPQGQRDEFQFLARVPATAGELQWKTYQTYTDGTVVAWDASPSEMSTRPASAADAFGPYGVTHVLAPAVASTASTIGFWADPQINFFIALLALVFSIVNFGLHGDFHLLPDKPKKRRK